MGGSHNSTALARHRVPIFLPRINRRLAQAAAPAVCKASALAPYFVVAPPLMLLNMAALCLQLLCVFYAA
jgi:hypothetical protein